LSRLFFPSNDENASLLLTLGTFGVSYIGALVLGAYADRAGRKASLLVSIQLMMIGALLMAVLPTYRSIGMLAPVGVLVARLMQGFSIGGEFGSGTSFLGAKGLLRQLSMGGTRAGSRTRVGVRDRARHGADARPARGLGMATSLLIRSLGRADRPLYPPSH
jgi:MHS family proline/betaine transporter-like MFS transporter